MQDGVVSRAQVPKLADQVSATCPIRGPTDLKHGEELQALSKDFLNPPALPKQCLSSPKPQFEPKLEKLQSMNLCNIKISAPTVMMKTPTYQL